MNSYSRWYHPSDTGQASHVLQRCNAIFQLLRLKSLYSYIQPFGIFIYNYEECFPFKGSCIIQMNPKPWFLWEFSGVKWCCCGHFAVQLTHWTALNTDSNVFINSWPPHITSSSCLHPTHTWRHVMECLYFFYQTEEWWPTSPITDNTRVLLFHPSVWNMVGWCPDLFYQVILTRRKPILWTFLGPNKVIILYFSYRSVMSLIDWTTRIFLPELALVLKTSHPMVSY